MLIDRIWRKLRLKNNSSQVTDWIIIKIWKLNILTIDRIWRKLSNWFSLSTPQPFLPVLSQPFNYTRFWESISFFGYYIFGWVVSTGNVITENVIIV